MSFDVPGLVAKHLLNGHAGDIRDALRDGRTIRRGQGYSVRVTEPLTMHLAMVDSRHSDSLSKITNRSWSS